MRDQFFDDCRFRLGHFVPRAHGFVQPVAALLQGREVGEDQFRVDDFDVPHRVDISGDMMDVPVFKTADHLDNGVDLADVAQELVSQALPLARAAHKARDIHELDHRRHEFLRVRYL